MKPSLNHKLLGILLLVLTLGVLTGSAAARRQADPAMTFPPQTGTLWSPYLEWSLSNPSYSGNPYDLVATVTFTHSASGETRVTEMFYDGGNTWKFRFAGTQTGAWTFSTSSSDADLNGHTGSVTINPNPNAPGFVAGYENKWIRTGTLEAFVPQFVMASGPHNYYNNAARVDNEINTFMVQHGFTGFHTPVFCRWFDINEPDCDNIGGSSPNPDPRTFEALELLITKTYAAGGSVHIWAWGDDSRDQTPKSLPGGINGAVDQRLQRYIAARLGPIPGWTMGYGFDLFEWVNENQLDTWHAYMQDHLGWTHYLGARSNKNSLKQLSEVMDYSSYEQHQPDYDMYVATIEERPNKPSFSEDRFRIRNEGLAKDYTMLETRRGLWDSAMAGGIANIWGNLLGNTNANDGTDTSLPYPNPEWIKTYAQFMNGRFTADLSRCNQLTNGVCLQRPNNVDFIFYGENVKSLQMDLSGMVGSQTAVAVDAAGAYAEINLGTLPSTNQTWTAPYRSDWAIAVGPFVSPVCINFEFNQTNGGAAALPTVPQFATAEYNVFLPFIGNNYCRSLD